MVVAHGEALCQRLLFHLNESDVHLALLNVRSESQGEMNSRKGHFICTHCGSAEFAQQRRHNEKLGCGSVVRYTNRRPHCESLVFTVQLWHSISLLWINASLRTYWATFWRRSPICIRSLRQCGSPGEFTALTEHMREVSPRALCGIN